jgi:hypothetical protein
MGAAFGAGVAYSLVSGMPNPLQSAFTTGAAFAGFNGLFYQVSKQHNYQSANLHSPSSSMLRLRPQQLWLLI